MVAEPRIRLHPTYLWKQGCVLTLKRAKTVGEWVKTQPFYWLFESEISYSREFFKIKKYLFLD